MSLTSVEAKKFSEVESKVGWMKSGDAEDDDRNQECVAFVETSADHKQGTLDVSSHSTPHAHPPVIADAKTQARSPESADSADSV